MTIYRMRFDVAVRSGNDVPCVYDIQHDIVKAIQKLPYAVGAESDRRNTLCIHSIDASELIRKQVATGEVIQ